MKRGEFLRNSLMALAVSFVPKILQPIDVVEYSKYETITYAINNESYFIDKQMLEKYTLLVRDARADAWDKILNQ